MALVFLMRRRLKYTAYTKENQYIANILPSTVVGT